MSSLHWRENQQPGKTSGGKKKKKRKGNETNKQTTDDSERRRRRRREGEGGREGGRSSRAPRRFTCSVFCLFSCFPVPRLCGEIHCRLLTRCFFIFSVCVFDCVCGEATGQDLLRRKVTRRRKISGGAKVEMSDGFMREGGRGGNYIQIFFLCPGAV